MPPATVPRRFIDGADEVVVVDAPPAAPADGADETGLDVPARSLSLLRQRALLLTADVVDRQLEAYLELHGVPLAWGTQERILVCMTPRANAAAMLASGRRNADRFHGELLAVYVNQPNLTDGGSQRAGAQRHAGARAARPRRDAGRARPDRAPSSTSRAAQGVTQLFVGHNLRRTWRTALTGSLLDRLIDDAEGMDVRVFPH